MNKKTNEDFAEMIIDLSKEEDTSNGKEWARYFDLLNIIENIKNSERQKVAKEIFRNIERLTLINPSMFLYQHLKQKFLNHSPQTKPYKVGLEDEKQGSLDTTGNTRLKPDDISTEMLKDKTADTNNQEVKK